MVEKLYELPTQEMACLLLSSLQSLQQPNQCSHPKPYESADNDFVHNNLSFLTGGGKLKDPGMNDNSVIQ
jgi:hypothetical protein